MKVVDELSAQQQYNKSWSARIEPLNETSRALV